MHDFDFSEVIDHGLCRFVSRMSVFLKRAHDDRADFGVLYPVGDGDGAGLCGDFDDFFGVFWHRAFACDHFDEHEADGEEVSGGRGFVAIIEFRGDVLRRAHDFARLGEFFARFVFGFCDAEIEDFDKVFFADDVSEDDV